MHQRVKDLLFRQRAMQKQRPQLRIRTLQDLIDVGRGAHAVFSKFCQQVPPCGMLPGPIPVQ